MANLDARPEALNVTFRPGSVVTLNLNGPAGWLSSRAFTATLNGTSLSVSESTDTLVIVAGSVVTAALSSPGTTYPFVLHLTGGNDALIGSWKASDNASPDIDVDATLLIDSLNVAVTLLGSGAGGAGVASVVEGHGIDVDAADPANPIVAVDESELDIALMGGNLTDAQVPATIARDSEVVSAVAVEAALARNADNLTSGTVADTRIASTIARDSEVAAAVLVETNRATAAEALLVPTSRTVSTTAPLTGGGDLSTNRTLAISAASSGAAGSMSAADKTKLDSITGTNTGDQTITLTGDVTGSGTGSFAATIATNSVTNAKAAQMAAHTFKGNNTASTANASDLTVAQMKTELGLTGTNSGDQTITLTGDVTGSGSGSFAATVAADAVDNTKLANMAAATFKMRAAGAGTGDPIDGTAAQAKTALAIANTDVSGLGTLSTQSGTFSGTSSGTNTGDQTITLTGDVTGSGTASFAATLATVNSNTGTWGDATHVPQFTVDGKGRVTAVSSVTITAGATDAASVTFTPSGDIIAATVQAAIEEVRSDDIADLGAHNSDTTGVHGITDTALLYAAGGTDVAVADGGTGASSASAARTNLGLVIGTDVEAHDTDLTTIAGLSPSNDDFMQRKAGAWANRSVAQVKTDLGLTGTNSGDQTITLTGDVTGSGTGSFAATLKNTGPGATGPIGDATHVPVVTIDAQGRVTALSSAAITDTGMTALTGDVTASGSGSQAATLATVNSNVGSFGSATQVATVTVNGKGLVTAASNTTIAIPESAVTNLTTDLAAKAPLASPTLTGTPAAPTAAQGTNTTQIATTAMVQSEVTLLAPKASPALTGTPSAPTASVGTDTTQVATTSFVQAAKLAVIPSDKTADYTLVLGDVGSSIGVDSATAKNVTVPLNSSVAYPVGSIIEVRQVGVGQVTIVATGGVTLRSAGSALKTRAQYSAVSLLKVATDTWSVQGDLTT